MNPDGAPTDAIDESSGRTHYITRSDAMRWPTIGLCTLILSMTGLVYVNAPFWLQVGAAISMGAGLLVWMVLHVHLVMCHPDLLCSYRNWPMAESRLPPYSERSDSPDEEPSTT